MKTITCILLTFFTYGAFSQNVGIGTINPLSKLHVAGTIRSDTLIYIGPGVRSLFATPDGRIYDSLVIPSTLNWQITGNNNIGAANFLGTTNANDLIFKTNNTENARILNSNGFVGIGTSTPLSKLYVSQGWATVTFDGFSLFNAKSFGAGHPVFIGLKGQGTEASASYPVSGDVLSAFAGRDVIDGITAINYGGASMYFYATENFSAAGKGSNIKFGTTPNGSNIIQDRMLIEQNGYVGINSTTPGTRLEVGAIGGDGITIKATSGTDVGDLIFMDNAGVEKGRIYTNTTAASGLIFSGGSIPAPHVFIDNNGNTGIGTTTPITKLHVTGMHVGAGSGTALPNDAASQVIIPAGSDGSTYKNDWPAGWGGGLAVWDVVGSETFFTANLIRSDKKLKKDILNMDAELIRKILQLRPVTYYLKEQTPGAEGLQYGFIAQEVRELFPGIVTKSTDENSIIGMNYQALIAPAIYVIQQQQKEIETLKLNNTRVSEELDLLKKQQEDTQMILKKLNEEVLNLLNKKN